MSAIKSFSELRQNIQELPFRSQDYIPLLIKQGDMSIGPKKAEKILKETHFDGQRNTDPTYVSMHIEQMRRGTFLDNTQIAFCRIGDAYYLVNGKHRLTAVSLGSHDVRFSVVVYDCADMEEVRSIYARFDSVARPRSSAQIRSAFDLDKEMGVSAFMAKAVYDAVPLLSNRLRPIFYNHELSEDVRIEMGIPEIRSEAARSWAKPAQLFERAIKKAPPKLKRKLLTANNASVALMTLKHAPEKAFEFWEGLALDDGLRRGDPRKTLLIYFENHDVRLKLNAVMVPGIPWNYFFRGEKLTQIIVKEQTEIKILGTPLDGRRK